MSTAAKLAGVAGLAGMMMAVTIAALMHPPADPVLPVGKAHPVPATPWAAELRRCRAITVADSGCDAVWEAERRRFFGEESGQ